ncbi:MAG: hypothetical protein EXR72_23605 [Myxococcales bacterium]|nr:hypothetical protein [Myxococcales bacterium]
MRTQLFGGLLVAALAGGGCVAAGGWPEIVDTRSLSAGGTPFVRQIRDLGTLVPAGLGALTGEPDGVASPGEVLLIEGSGFGKQPTVTIGARAAEVVGRTSGGGILVRVPVALPLGNQEVLITVGDARVRASFPIRRIAIAVHDGRVHALSINGNGNGNGTVVQPPIDLADASAVRMAPDGSCAYVIAGGKLAVIDLGAAGGPKVITTRELEVQARFLVAAERAPVIFAVGDGEAQGFEIKTPRQPARYDRFDLPAETKGAHAVELDPDGRRMAFLFTDGNRLQLVDVSTPTAARLLGSVALLPEVRAPLVRDLAFASDGETLWVLAGDNEASLHEGPLPTRLAAVRLEGDPANPTLTLWRTTLLPETFAPLRLLLSRTPPPPSGATIRDPPEKAAIFFTAAQNTLFSGSDAQTVGSLFAGKEPGAIDRGGAEGGGHLFTTNLLFGPIDASAQIAVAGAGRVAPRGREYGVATFPLGAGARATFTRLGAATESDFTPPFGLGDIRIQP